MGRFNSGQVLPGESQSQGPLRTLQAQLGLEAYKETRAMALV